MTVNPDYKVIAKECAGEYKEKGSTFTAFAYPAVSREAAEARVKELKKNHPGAVHVCSGYVIGFENPIKRANDDGEPSNSAGSPILNQIEAAKLHNTAIAVVRYYGGVKLGVSGLINAYKTAAAMALENGSVRTLRRVAVYKLKTDYTRLGTIERLLEQLNATVSGRDFMQEVKLEFFVSIGKCDALEKAFEPYPDDELIKIKECIF